MRRKVLDTIYLAHLNRVRLFFLCRFHPNGLPFSTVNLRHKPSENRPTVVIKQTVAFPRYSSGQRSTVGVLVGQPNPAIAVPGVSHRILCCTDEAELSNMFFTAWITNDILFFLPFSLPPPPFYINFYF